MAEQNREKLNIRLHVYDEEILTTVKRDEEQYYRAAAKLVTERYNAYADAFKGRKGDHTIALMTLVDIALLYEKERENHDTAPYDNILERLTADIDEALQGR